MGLGWRIGASWREVRLFWKWGVIFLNKCFEVDRFEVSSAFYDIICNIFVVKYSFSFR